MSPTGPSAAHERLCEQQAFLRRLARSLVSDPHRAEDLAQDATLIALERPPEGVGSLRAWLARVLRNRAVNVGLGEERRRRREAAAEPPTSPPAPDELEARFAVQRRVIAAVDGLDEPYRSTILLRYYEDLGPAAIAERLGVPVATVKSRLARGLARLREDLDRTQPEGGRAWALVLAGGLGELSRPAAVTATTTGGIAMTVKLAWIAASVGGVVLGGWWIAQPGAGSVPPSGAVSAQGRVLPDASASTPGSQREVPSQAARTAVAPLQPGGSSGTGGKSTAAWLLQVELHGWSDGDPGPVALEVLRAEESEPALTTSAALADAIGIDVGGLFADADTRPDRLRVRVDHPAYLPREAGVLVSHELLQPDVVTGQLHTLVELVRAKAAVTGTVEVNSDDPEARARVAILPFKLAYPHAEPIEVVEPDAAGRFRLRADDAERHAVVAFDARSGLAPPEGTDVTLRPLTQAMTLAPGEERELGTLVVDEGLSIEGYVVLPGGSAAGSGSVHASPKGQLKAGPFGLAWAGDGYESTDRAATWDEAGSFVLAGLGPREYSVAAMPSRGDLPASCIGIRKTGDPVLVVPPASNVYLTLEETVRVTFEVRAEGQPLPEAALTIYWPDPLLGGYQTVSTDDAGQRMLDFDPAGGLRVEARDARHGARELSLTADELRATDLFVLDLDGPPVDPATLVIDVPPEHATSLEGVGLHISLIDVERCTAERLDSARRYSRTSAGGGGVDWASLDPGGPKPVLTREGSSWELAGIPAGEYLVRLDPMPTDRDVPFFVENEQLEVTLAPGDRSVHTWIPRTGGLVRLNFLGPEQPFWAEVLGSDEAELGLTYTRPGPGLRGWSFGKASSLGVSRVFPALPPAQYLLRISRKGGLVDFVPFEVIAGQVNDVEVDLGGL